MIFGVCTPPDFAFGELRLNFMLVFLVSISVAFDQDTFEFGELQSA